MPENEVKTLLVLGAFTKAEKGSIILAVNLLAQALAENDRAAVRLARVHLAAIFPDKPAPEP